MKEFSSLADFAAHLIAREAAMHHSMHHALEKAAKLIEKTAKDELGHYQQASGPFPEWKQLAPATLAHHAAYGVGDTPLLLTGGLYASIEHEVHGHQAVIGTKSEIGAYQEFGTTKIPPRPFMGPAAYNNLDKIKAIIGKGMVAGLIGGTLSIDSDF